VRLAPGAMRDRLIQMCRSQGVSVRDLLVWRTHGSMSNGAVVGVLGPLRYILLTDALLDSLSEREVEAVMAHEIAHVRHRHMIWLALAMLASVGVFASVAATVAEVAGLGSARGGDVTLWEWLIAGAAFAAGLTAFGFVSRRFEWQSDAFAVQHLSGARRRREPGEAAAPIAVVAPAAIVAMVGALESVARLNHIPVRKFSWRHGSIASRIERLRGLGGRRTDELPIDRAVRVIKAVTLVVVGVLFFIAVREAWQGGVP
jgi:STE24 endopeptidase